MSGSGGEDEHGEQPRERRSGKSMSHDASQLLVQESEAPQGGPAGPAPRLGGLFALAGKGSMSIVDQAVVSATNFLTTILIGRVCGPRELGVYSLGFTIVMLMIAVQFTLVIMPYTIYHRRLDAVSRRHYAGSVLVHSLLLYGLMVVGFVTGGIVLSLGSWPPGFTAMIWTLAWAVPLILLREFGRRFSLVELKPGAAFVLDAAVGAVHLGGLAFLVASHRLSAAASYTVYGLACAALSAVWWLFNCTSFRVRANDVLSKVRLNWSFGKWVFADHLTMTVNAYASNWLLMAMLGAKATGTFAACTSVILLANPFVLGMNNLLVPKAAQVHARGDSALVRDFLRKATLLMIGGTSAFFVFILIFGNPLMRLLYGSNYGGQGHVTAVLAMDLLVCGLAVGPGYGLWLLERSDVLFLAKLVRFAAIVIGSIGLIYGWGVLGAAYGMLLGDAVGVTATVVMHRRIVAARGAIVRATAAVGAEGNNER